MNNLDTYKHWSQGYQGEYHVQYAQYKNCVFLSDNGYISTLTERTNYTLYASSELPLCYSTIRENTYKAFYFAYGVTNDPNWYNEDYLYSFSLATYATQTWSYYGARSIGVFNSAVRPIPLPKDCRGLMFYSPAIENVGVLDATNTTNFGAKSGSWRDAFGYCSSLKNLYIKNLKVNINISWSPVNLESIEYIINNAVNTSAITIYVSPYTWNLLTNSIKTAATNKNINIVLLEGNYMDDNRWNTKQDVISDIDDIRSGAALSQLVSDRVDNIEIQQINHGIENTTYTILPNVFNIWGEVSTLDITLGEEIPNICNEYMFQFVSGQTPTTLILPDDILWVNDFPEIESNKTYQCSIINNIAIICGV